MTFRPPLLAAALGLLACGLTALPTAAQTCPSPTDTFWQNDLLPQNPGPLPSSIAIVQGLCEGEAAAQVFTLPPGSQPQRINKVAVGFAAPAGGSGFVASCNIEIYDGVSFSGGLPDLGTKIFDLSDDLGAEMQLSSTSINEFDLTGQDIVVGQAGDSFAVAFRMSFNPNGTCAGGFSANFFTDDGTGSCSTFPETSLIDLQGIGWRDASTAMVGGFPLCPLFYNGNWVIRACSEDAGGTGNFVDLGFNLTGTFAPNLAGDGSLAGGDVFTLTFSGQPPSTTAFLFLDVVTLYAPFKGGTLVPGVSVLINFPTPATAFDNTVIPLSLPTGLPSGASLYWQSWYMDAGGPAGLSATNGLESILP